MTHMTQAPWPLHHFIPLMGLGGGVAWWYVTGQPSFLSILSAINRRLKLNLQLLITGLNESVSNLETSTKNEIRRRGKLK